jgi:hypothetical protein
MPFTQILAPRLLQGALFVLADIATFRLAEKLFGRTAAKWAVRALYA